MPSSNCTHLFIGSLSCDVSKWNSSGLEEKFSATLLEQPFAPDNCTFGLALDNAGAVYLAGTTGFSPSDFPMIERFDFNLDTGVLWKDLSTLTYTWSDPTFQPVPATMFIEPRTCFGTLALMFDARDNLWLLTFPRSAISAAGPLTLYKMDYNGNFLDYFIIHRDPAFPDDPGNVLYASPDSAVSMDITSTGVLVIEQDNGDTLYTFNTKAGRQGNNITLQPTTFVHSTGDISITPLDNNIYLVENFVPGDISFNNVHIVRYTLSGQKLAQYDLPTIHSSFRRVISRGPDDRTVWASSTVNNFTTDMPPYVWLVDISTGGITKGGNLTTNFGSEAIFNMAVCRKNIRAKIPQVTLIGAT